MNSEQNKFQLTVLHRHYRSRFNSNFVQCQRSSVKRQQTLNCTMCTDLIAAGTQVEADKELLPRSNSATSLANINVKVTSSICPETSGSCLGPSNCIQTFMEITVHALHHCVAPDIVQRKGLLELP